MRSIAFAAHSLSQLKNELLSHAPNEAAAVLLAGPAVQQGRTELLVRQIEFVTRDALLRQDTSAVVISPIYLAPRLKTARLEQLSMVIAHTHPFSAIPQFSPIDNEGERKLIPSVFNRAPNVPHGSIVLGTEGFDARIWLTPSTCEPVTTLRSVGRTLQITDNRSVAWPDNMRFDRNVRAFGQAGQKMIGALKIGIVGLGGIGSIVAQQLVYLGVCDFVLIDPEVIEVSNLNRVVGATKNDISRPKVNVAAEMVRQVAIEPRVLAMQGSVVRAQYARDLLACDFIFCCTDSLGSRAVLNAIAYQYYIPVIDSGVRIDARQGIVESISGRVQMLAPGIACLICHNLLDSEEVRRDLLSEDERRRDPYIVGYHEPAPAVISINSTVASLAVSMFLSAVVGMGSDARHQIYLGNIGTVRVVASTPNPDCIVCSLRGALGRGDSWNLPWRTA